MIQSFVLRQMKKNTKTRLSMSHYSMRLQQDKVRRLMYIQSQQHVCIILCVYMCLCVCMTSLHATPARLHKKGDVHAVPATRAYHPVCVHLCVCVTSLHATPARQGEKADVHAVPETHVYHSVCVHLFAPARQGKKADVHAVPETHVYHSVCVHLCVCVCDITPCNSSRQGQKADVHAVPATHMCIVFFRLTQNSAVQYICNGPVGKVIWQQ